MSIINKMHQDFEQIQQAQPILANMPTKKSRQKIFLVLLLILLILFSLGFSYLIFIQKRDVIVKTVTGGENSVVSAVNLTVKKSPEVRILPEKKSAIHVPVRVAVEKQTVDNSEHRQMPIVEQTKIKAAKGVSQAVSKEEKLVQQPLIDKTKVLQAAVSEGEAKKNGARSQSQQNKMAGALHRNPNENDNYLEIKTAKLSKSQLAHIHLKKADKAQAKGDLESAAKERLQALTLLPTLNEVRKSLVLYYYSQGQIDTAYRLLTAGVLASPNYSDFNLMLSRIAVKGGDYDKAYLYLAQHPPEIEDNLDYYVSYAILAQKLEKYARAEQLYKRLLSQRPYNGRWRMSLAIVQDKQGKTEFAVDSYKTALLQPDLSAKAKAYIKQRLSYLQ